MQKQQDSVSDDLYLQTEWFVIAEKRWLSHKIIYSTQLRSSQYITRFQKVLHAAEKIMKNYKSDCEQLKTLVTIEMNT